MSDINTDIKNESNTPKPPNLPNPPNHLEALNSILAFQVQDLIDKKLDKAESWLREDYKNKWIWVSVLGAVVTVIFSIIFSILGFVGYQAIRSRVKTLVEEKMTVPALEKATEETISKRMPEFVDNKFKAVEEKVEEKTDKLNKLIETTSDEIREKQNLAEEKTNKLTSFIETTSREISEKQILLENAQSVLKEQLNIQQCAIAAKAGKRDKYEELKNIAEKKSEFKEFVDAALKDIEFYYEAIKYEQVGCILLDPISKKDPGFSIEEVIYFYRNSDVKLDMREGAIDTLIAYNNTQIIKDNVVQELCESVNSEQNLRVIARTTLLLNSLTGMSFRALEMDAVRDWWELNKNETKYQSPFKHYFAALECKPSPPVNMATQIISLLDKCILAEPDALHARCLRGFNLMLLEDFDKAEKEFKIVEERNKDFRWLLLFRSILFAYQNKTDEAVGLLNQALAKSPAIKDSVKELPTMIAAYKKVVENKGVKWPDDKQ